ncbi:MAG TPA: hydrolase [Erysipelotrichaceae bacterium]|nr:hydrolase [Erysipelotrichaceae bacterium]
MTIIQRVIPGYTEADNVTGCCPVFHPELYDNKVFDLSEYQFIKDSTLSFMHIPLNMDRVFTRVMRAIDQSKQAYDDHYLILSRDMGPFKSNHYFLTKGDVEGYKTEKIEGHYFAKVYDGEFKDIEHWLKDFKLQMTNLGQTLNELFVFYTTCPNCAKVYGHNYVVLFGKTQQ